MTERSAPTFFVRCLPDGAGGPAPRVDDITALITSFKYEDFERRADKLTLSVVNSDLAFFDDPAFRRGMMLEATWGYPGNMAPARQCIVQRITGGRVLQVEALARSVLMNLRTRVRTFTNMTRADVASQIASENGYGLELQVIEDTEIRYPTITQARLTDAQFLMRLARMEGFEFFVDVDGFHWHRRNVAASPVRTFRYFTSEVGEILDFSIENDVTARPGRVRARGRNLTERTDIDEQADDQSDADRTVLATTREVIDFEQGTTTTVTQTERNVGSEEVRTTSAPDAQTARREAVGRFRRVQQTAVKMTLQLVGDPSLLAKTVVAVEGLGQRLSGRYYVQQVTHEITGAYRMSAKVVSDGAGGHSTESRAARGLELLEQASRTAAHPNTQEGPPAATGAPTEQEGQPLEQVEVIDNETGTTRTQYRDTRGRAPGTGGT
jgi:phage protein D